MSNKPDRVVVIGQGYVGLPVAARAALAGYTVVGFEVDHHKVDALNSGRSHVEDVTDEAYASLLEQIPALAAPVQAILSEEEDGDAESPAMIASAVELVLEGLHLSKRLNKDRGRGRAQFRSRS